MNAPMILDVDTGVDDAVAIALAISRAANVIGISTVAGNVPIGIATRNTRDVLAWLGREDIPVHRGASRPLAATYADASDVHGANGLGGWTPPPSLAPEQNLAGPAFIIQSAERYAGDLVLVTLGPLTNLAIALNVRPELIEQIASIVVMGGAYQIGGNVTPHAEFNVFVDPDAAGQVFSAPWRDITLVGLDVTHRAAFPRSAWEQIPKNATGASGLLQRVMARTFIERKMPGFYLHDPLAVAVALDPSLVSGDLSRVEVAISAELRGKTTISPDFTGPMAALNVDAGRFLAGFGEAFGVEGVSVGEGLQGGE